MALTPEDVLNKNFTATQFRRGYDEQEVDDFLDEVVVELRRLSGENSELRRKLEACQQNRNLQDSAPVAVAAVGPDGDAVRRAEAATKAEIERIQRESEDRIAKARAGAEQAEKDAQARIQRARSDAQDAERQAQSAQQSAVQARMDAEEAQSRRSVTMPEGMPQTSTQAIAALTGGGAADAAGVIALAQKLHDEYVSQGKAEHDRLLGEATRQRDQMLAEATNQRDQMLAEANNRRDQLLGEAQSRHDDLIGSAEARHAELVGSAQNEHDRLLAEANETHERLITEARQRSTGMLAEAQQKRQTVVEELERTQAQLNYRIAELRQFEQDYRNRLRNFIEGQLHSLTTQDTVAPDSGLR